MYAVDFRSMRTAVHGLFVGKNRRRVDKFYDRLKVIFCDNEILPEEQLLAYNRLVDEYPDIELVEEVDFRTFHANKRGIWGCVLNGKWCRIVNLVSLDIWFL